MAKGTVRNSFSDPVIRKLDSEIEKTIDSSSIVLSSSIQKFFGPGEETVYLKGHVTIIDSATCSSNAASTSMTKALSPSILSSPLILSCLSRNLFTSDDPPIFLMGLAPIRSALLPPQSLSAYMSYVASEVGVSLY